MKLYEKLCDAMCLESFYLFLKYIFCESQIDTFLFKFYLVKQTKVQ